VPDLLRRVFLVSMASGITSSEFQNYFPNIVRHSTFTQFASQVCAYTKRMRNVHRRQDENSLQGVKRRLSELEMECAGKDAECERLRCELKRLRKRESGSVETPKLDWRVDDIKMALNRINNVKRKQSSEYLDAVQQEFDCNIWPAMKVLSRGGSLGLPQNTAKGKKLVSIAILACIMKNHCSKDMLVQEKANYDNERRLKNPKSKSIYWNMYALNVLKGAYDISISSLDAFKRSYVGRSAQKARTCI
jgi:hypothetical protein